MLRVLADAIGTRGMAGGQAIDLEAVKQRLGEAGTRAHASTEDRRTDPGQRHARRHLRRLRRCCATRRARGVWRGDRSRVPDPGRHSRRRRKYRHCSENAPAPTRIASSPRIRRCSAWTRRAPGPTRCRDRAIAALAPWGRAFRASARIRGISRGTRQLTDWYGRRARLACKLRHAMSIGLEDFPLLRSVNLPADLRAQPENRLGEVCAELREYPDSQRRHARRSLRRRTRHRRTHGGAALRVQHAGRPAGLGRRSPGLPAQGAHRPSRPARHHQAERRSRAVSVARRKRVRHLRRGSLEHFDQRGARHGGGRGTERRGAQGGRGDR